MIPFSELNRILIVLDKVKKYTKRSSNPLVEKQTLLLVVWREQRLRVKDSYLTNDGLILQIVTWLEIYFIGTIHLFINIHNAMKQTEFY